MAFSTLEERFNQISNQIYNRYAPSGDQYVSVKPNTSGPLGSESRIKNDSRSVPTVSTARDVTRITKFWNSPEGRLFIGKQLLLQTGNTFAETRFYNPANILLTAVPFIGTGITRHVGKPFGLQTLKTPTRDLRGALQQETLNKFSPDGEGRGLLAQLNTVRKSPSSVYGYEPTLTKYFGDPEKEYTGKEYYLRPEDTAFYKNPIKLTWTRRGNITAYDDNGLTDNFGSAQFSVQSMVDRGNAKQGNTFATNFVTVFKKYATQRPQPVVAGSKTFKELENTANTNGYFLGKLLDAQNISPDIDNATIAAQNLNPGSQTKFPAVVDPYNGIEGMALDPISINEDDSPFVGTPVGGGTSVNTSLYKNIMGDPKNNPVYANADKTDIIKFIFRTTEPDASPVHFRAFLSSLKQSVKPEFNEQRYIGRTERFVTYGGAKRSATLEFNIVAFGQTEIQQVWARINYLTGLAFPRGVSTSGFMIPPLFRMTIGNIYNDQPCYIDSMDYDFLEENTTFDIDNEVSQWVKVNMNVVLLEKRSRFYDSPFYAITEQQLAG